MATSATSTKYISHRRLCRTLTQKRDTVPKAQRGAGLLVASSCRCIVFGRKGIHTTITCCAAGKGSAFLSIFSAEFWALVIPSHSQVAKNPSVAPVLWSLVFVRGKLHFWKEKVSMSRRAAAFHRIFCPFNTDSDASHCTAKLQVVG